MNDISKLPKWAQTEFSCMERKIKDLTAELAVERTLPTSLIEINPYNASLNIPRKFIEDDSIIRFTLPCGWIEISIKYGRVELMGNAKFGTSLMVKPHVTNVVSVGFEKDTP